MSTEFISQLTLESFFFSFRCSPIQIDLNQYIASILVTMPHGYFVFLWEKNLRLLGQF